VKHESVGSIGAEMKKANIKMQRHKAKCKILISHLTEKNDEKRIRHFDVTGSGKKNDIL